MKTKNKIGALVVLGGIALLGAYWFKKNKPTIATSQAKALQKQLNLQDKPCDYFTNKVIDKIFNDMGISFFYKIGWFKKL